MRSSQIFILVFLIFTAFKISADYRIEIIDINNQKIHLTHWTDRGINPDTNLNTLESTSTIVLLSGPTDNWNSDSAWFARLAPKLAKTNRVISIDRAGQVLANQNAKVGYTQFGNDLNDIFKHLNLKNIKIISFASANLALNQYFSVQTDRVVESVIMIDPDVLLPTSIARYTKDALPFKENLEKYALYISSGKYDRRALQKNQMEMTHLKKLSVDDKDTDWEYIDKIFSKRLNKENLKNLFREIAIYDQDLNNAFRQGFPKNIPLTIIDTNFEQVSIDKAESAKAKKDLLDWKQEAHQYYNQLTKHSDRNQYIHLAVTEHLIPFSQPELLIDILSK